MANPWDWIDPVRKPEGPQLERSDLVCPTCGTGPRDLHPGAPLSGRGTLWTCQQGHRQISGLRPGKDGQPYLAHLPLDPERWNTSRS